MLYREYVTETQLLRILNQELARNVDEAEIRFTGYIALTAPGPDGCNWDPRPLRLTGDAAPTRYEGVARRVLERATRRYGVKQ